LIFFNVLFFKCIVMYCGVLVKGRRPANQTVVSSSPPRSNL
jgi:hypothetical protein